MTNEQLSRAAIEFAIAAFAELGIPSSVSKAEFFFIIANKDGYMFARRTGMVALAGGRATREKLSNLAALAVASIANEPSASGFDFEGGILSRQEARMLAHDMA